MAAASSPWRARERTDAGGVRVHAALAGSRTGATVVLVHGLGCSHRYWARLAAALPDVRVVAPDLPGFGDTPGPRPALGVSGLADALGDWLRATGRSGSVVVAHSLGCQVVADLAARRPTDVGPLVLASPTVDADRRTWHQQVGWFGVDLLRERPSLYPVLLRDAVGRGGPRRVVRTFDAALSQALLPLLGDVRATTVVTRGHRDTVVPEEWAREVADRLPDGRFVGLPGAHGLLWTHPGPLAGLVREVLAARARAGAGA